MNSPVTRSECQAHMKEMEERFYVCLGEDKVELKEAIDDVKEFVIRVEGKFDTLIKEVAIIGIGAFLAYVWGKL